MKSVKVLSVLLIALLCVLLVQPIVAEPVKMAPDKIVLNALGSALDVQAIISKAMPSGYRIADYQVDLYFDGILVAEANRLEYCYIDYNFLAGFDKISLLTNPDVIAMANTTVTAFVDGTVFIVNSEGDELVLTFSGSDEVEIVDPAKSTKIPTPKKR